MFILRDQVAVRAPVDRCFLLSTAIAIVEKELGMHPVAGRTEGFVEEGDTVRWQGWQLGLPQYHESLITSFERNRFFQDRMIAGRFASFQHDHSFRSAGNGVVTLLDELRFSMPFGWLGWLIGRVVLVPHIRGLMKRRFALIKRLAETEGWRDYLPSSEAHLTS